MRSSDERTGRKNSRTVIFMVRVVFVYLFAQFSRMFAIFRNVGYLLFSAFRNFAVSHTNESSSSVDTHLVETIRVHLGYLFAMFNVLAD